MTALEERMLTSISSQHFMAFFSIFLHFLLHFYKATIFTHSSTFFKTFLLTHSYLPFVSLSLALFSLHLS